MTQLPGCRLALEQGAAFGAGWRQCVSGQPAYQVSPLLDLETWHSDSPCWTYNGLLQLAHKCGTTGLLQRISLWWLLRTCWHGFCSERSLLAHVSAMCQQRLPVGTKEDKQHSIGAAGVRCRWQQQGVSRCHQTPFCSDRCNMHGQRWHGRASVPCLCSCWRVVLHSCIIF